MHYLFILSLLGFFAVIIHCRPSQSVEINASQEEVEYDGDNGSPNEDTLEDSSFRDEEPTSQDLEENRRLLDLNRNINLHRKLAEDTGTRANLDIPDFKPVRSRDVRNDKPSEDVNSNDEFQTYGKQRQYSKYIENSDANDQLEVAQHLTNHDVNNYKSNRMHNNMILDTPLSKRTVESKNSPTEEGELLFENNHEQNNNFDQNYYNIDEALDSNQRSSDVKLYNNQMQSDNKVMFDSLANSRNNEYSYSNRDRRETQNQANLETGNEGLGRTDSENEEMAIKRHIKTMSSDELEQLLNSLSEEKRSLLMKIIDDADMSAKPYDNINKREITKKAGAVEDSFMENGQSESSKVQGGFSSLDVTTPYPPSTLESSDTSKPTENQPDSTSQTNTKSQETNSDSIVELNKNNENNPGKSDNSFAPNTDSNNNQAEVVPNEQVTLKNENKRETNMENIIADAVSLEDQKNLESEDTKESRIDASYFSPREEDLSQLLDDVDQSRVYDDSRIYKRDAEKQLELDSKLKSLEESFPNADTYDSVPYSGPLIRVKRTNTERGMKKRAAAVLPDSKVGFIPYKAENEDEDAGEGNEFDDDGFYDPSPNFVNNENKNTDGNSQQIRADDSNCKLNNIDQSKSPISEASDGTISLGSDTDNILSGVEGVDENLMFSSGNRNKRKTDDLSENIDETNHIQSVKISEDVTKSSSNNNMNIPNYQENDAFGGLPRNYEGDLGRYKRIRRVKQSHITEEPSST